MTKSTTIPLYKRNLTIIPTPASLNVSPDRVLRLQAVEIILCTELCDTRVEHNDEQINNCNEIVRAEVDIMVAQLCEDLRNRGITLHTMSVDLSSHDEERTMIKLQLDSTLKKQSYTLNIAECGIIISGGNLSGLRYGVQTLRQIIRQSTSILPQLHIEDYPVTLTRGYYLDVSRGRVPTLNWLKRWADELCLYKYNQLQLYIEHAFAFPGMSEVWRGASPLTADDIRDFDTYCYNRGIELVPSVSTFGHMYMILRSEQFRGLGEFPNTADRPFSFVERMHHHTLNVTLEESFKLSKRLVDAYMPLFRSRKFNICADETFDLGKGCSRYAMPQLEVSAMYVKYVNRLCEYISSCDHEPMLWGDIAVEMPEVLPQLPSNAILLNWQYDPDCTDEKIALVGKQNVRQVVCPAVHAWNRLLPFIEPTWRNISHLARYGRESHAEGFLLTDWGDYGHINDPAVSKPAMIMGGQCSWSAREFSCETMCSMISRLAYGDCSGEFVTAVDRACIQTASVWEDIVRFIEVEEQDGTVNADVVNSVWWIDVKHRQSVCQNNDLSGARQIIMQPTADKYLRYKTKSERGSDALRIMQDACDKAYGNSVCLLPDDIQVWLLCAQGQDLMNDVGLTLAVRCGAIDIHDINGGLPEPDVLAQKVERWFEKYCDRWREVSRESELRRIATILWEACDYLRREQPVT